MQIAATLLMKVAAIVFTPRLKLQANITPYYI